MNFHINDIVNSIASKVIDERIYPLIEYNLAFSLHGDITTRLKIDSERVLRNNVEDPIWEQVEDALITTNVEDIVKQEVKENK